MSAYGYRRVHEMLRREGQMDKACYLQQVRRLVVTPHHSDVTSDDALSQAVDLRGQRLNDCNVVQIARSVRWLSRQLPLPSGPLVGSTDWSRTFIIEAPNLHSGAIQSLRRVAPERPQVPPYLPFYRVRWNGTSEHHSQRWVTVAGAAPDQISVASMG